jgi:predicted CXXCH cytochrome family protein
MKEQVKKKVAVCVVLFLTLAGFVFLLSGGSAVQAQPGEPKAVLTNADCVKCHNQESMEIATAGKAHATAVSCRECHEDHRPRVANNIPACNLCHAGTPHFELDNCRSCHNPHAPLDITLQGELKDVCVTCHQAVGNKLVVAPSKHTGLSCNACHAEKHGVIPSCVQCHESHGPEMVAADCRFCHDAHQPLALNYPPEVSPMLCAACHDQAAVQLANSGTKHRGISCAECHPQTHASINQCADCHGMPHAKGMHERFPKCGDCHGTAHDLNGGSSGGEK